MDRRKSASTKASPPTKPAPITNPNTAATLHWNDLPTWLQDNHYIYTGYRTPSNSYLTSVSSLTHLHNESVNIWTHLLGALVSLTAALTLYRDLRPRYFHATSEDVGVFACFFAGTVACLGMSAAYHTLSNHSEGVARFGNKLDYVGIVALIWGSFVPAIYYGFSAEPRLVRVYWMMVCMGGVRRDEGVG